MDYSHNYNRLIIKAKNRSILPTIYKENHHIIPKCMGGSDNKNNIISLFPDEHLIAHLLLTKMYPNHIGLLRAAYCMTNGFNKISRNLNKEYKWLKEKYKERQRVWLKENHYLTKMSLEEKEHFLNKHIRGENNPNFGNKWSEKQRKNLSNKTKGRRIGKDNPNYGNKGERNPLFGKKQTEEHRRKVSLSLSGKKNPNYGNTGSKAPEAKKYKLTSPNGTVFELYGTLSTTISTFCIKHNLNLSRIKNNINKGIIGKTYKAYKNKIDVVNCEGWNIIKIDN